MEDLKIQHEGELLCRDERIAHLERQLATEIFLNARQEEEFEKNCQCNELKENVLLLEKRSRGTIEENKS